MKHWFLTVLLIGTLSIFETKYQVRVQRGKLVKHATQKYGLRRFDRLVGLVNHFILFSQEN